MKETGIIMSGNHPKLILDGIKTMTRRVIIPQPQIKGYFNIRSGELAYYWKGGKSLIKAGYGADYVHTDKDALIKAMLAVCPYGQVGRGLWVKETWATDKIFDAMSAKEIEDKGVATIPLWYKVADYQIENIKTNQGHWRSPRFMPRWASRITLEITEVRAERLQEIIGRDLFAEGIERRPLTDITYVGDSVLLARQDFIKLWDSHNAKRGYGWNMNPWVFPLSFKIVQIGGKRCLSE